MAPAKSKKPPVGSAEVAAILAQLEDGDIKQESHPALREILESYYDLLKEAEERQISIERLKRLLFGRRTEKSRARGRKPDRSPQPGPKSGQSKENISERKGHGRMPADIYQEAEVCTCEHSEVEVGQICPKCGRGRLRKQKPSIEMRISGQPPLGATRYELERLRCDTCGIVLTAPLPPEAPLAKYSPSAVSMIGLLKYGTGIPFYRLARLQQRLGVPLPVSTQYELLRDASQAVRPVFEHLWQRAADAELVFVDDSPMRILHSDGSELAERKATQTSVIVARCGEHWIYLYQTSRRHAGDNLERLFASRSSNLPPPIQMSDAAAWNASHPIQTLVTYCLVHARRYFFEIQDYFPEVCGRVLETLGEIFHVEKQAKDRDPLDRLQLHRRHSLPRLEELRDWLAERLEARHIEPNSSLGQAASYFLKHFEPLTGFCRIAGAPLENSVSERALKLSILNRKNAYFFRTDRGARVGDTWMSLIQTAASAAVNPFEYLTLLQQNASALQRFPENFLPWNAWAGG